MELWIERESDFRGTDVQHVIFVVFCAPKLLNNLSENIVLARADGSNVLRH
jgi:hypothetical protein